MRSYCWVMRTAAALAVLGFGLTVAACGGASSPTVAHIGSTTTTAAAGGSGGGGATLAEATKYSSCMRAHGISDFPDPTPGPNGGYGFQIQATPGSDLAPGSAANAAASKACRKDLPNNGVGKPLTAAQQQAFLNWAACIRAHGVPNFPDPTFSGGGIRIHVSAGSGLGGPNGGMSAAVQAAMQACKSKLPGGFAGIGG